MHLTGLFDRTLDSVVLELCDRTDLVGYGGLLGATVANWNGSSIGFVGGLKMGGRGRLRRRGRGVEGLGVSSLVLVVVGFSYESVSATNVSG